MNTLNKKSKRNGTKQKSQKNSKSSTKTKTKNLEVMNPKDEEIKIEQAIPFSDGIVSPKFSAFPMIPRVGDTEVDLLKSFLKYFSVTTLFVGTIFTKTSFMKKKGGRLL